MAGIIGLETGQLWKLDSLSSPSDLSCCNCHAVSGKRGKIGRIIDRKEEKTLKISTVCFNTGDFMLPPIHFATKCLISRMTTQIALVLGQIHTSFAFKF